MKRGLSVAPREGRIDTAPVSPSRAKEPPSTVSRAALQMMALILLALAALAIYSNVQKARRDKIETVTISPAPAPKSSPLASAAPVAP